MKPVIFTPTYNEAPNLERLVAAIREIVPSASILVVDDRSPDAFARVIDRLLASPRYGERWARHWLDVARYADSNGLDENLSYANAFRYRDYVIGAWNRDKPYSRFVQEQIAGDLLPETKTERENLDRLTATGFLAIGPKMLAEDDPVKMQMDIIDEQLSTLGQAFLGMTLGCARCHDHKFDPLPTADYYSLAGVFRNTRNSDPKSGLHTLSDSGKGDMKVALRGNLRKPGPIAPRRFLRLVAGADPERFTKGSGRLELADAVARPRRPSATEALMFGYSVDCARQSVS